MKVGYLQWKSCLILAGRILLYMDICFWHQKSFEGQMGAENPDRMIPHSHDLIFQRTNHKRACLTCKLWS